MLTYADNDTGLICNTYLVGRLRSLTPDHSLRFTTIIESSQLMCLFAINYITLKQIIAESAWVASDFIEYILRKLCFPQLENNHIKE